MTIKAGEVGKTIYVGTTFDVNAAPFTVISLTFTAPDGTTTFTRTDPLVAAPAVDSPALPNVGVLPANTYLTYLTQASDFIAGDWTVCSGYEDAVPSLFIGDETGFTVAEAC